MTMGQREAAKAGPRHRIHALLLCISIALVLHLQVSRHRETVNPADGRVAQTKSPASVAFLQTAEQTPTRTEPMAEQPKETIPPRKVFVDIGANCGNSYLKFKGDNKTDILEGKDWEAYLFEPNSQMHEFFLDDLAKQHSDITLIMAAASTEESEMDLYLTKGQEDITDKSQFSDGGVCDPNSSYNPSGASTLIATAKRAGKPEPVRTMDFAKWLQNQNLRSEDRLILKIDIEGAEVELLEHMMSDEFDAICRVEKIYIEWHPNIFPVDNPLHEKHLKYSEDFKMRFYSKCGHFPVVRKWN